MLTKSERALLNALVERQQERNWTDASMAVELRVSHALWSLIKREKRAMSLRFLRGVVRRFPELTNEANFVVRGDGTLLTDQSQKQSETEEVA